MGKYACIDQGVLKNKSCCSLQYSNLVQQIPIRITIRGGGGAFTISILHQGGSTLNDAL